MIRPTRRCGLLIAAGLPIALLPAVVAESLFAIWLAYAAGAFLLVGIDLLFVPRARSVGVEVTAPGLLYIGRGEKLRCELTARAGLEVEVLLDVDEILAHQPTARTETGPDGRGALEVPLVAHRRGTATVRAVWLRWTGPFGLISRADARELSRTIKVVPDTRAVREAAVRFFSSREFLSGLKVEHYIGDGSEFDQLREYVRGFDHRHIDWKASARHGKLLVREFRAERNHQIILAFDTGHLMAEPLGGIPKLDHAINAGLLLGFVCIKTGDRVGLLGFDESVRLWAEPQGGATAFHGFQARSAQLGYSTVETNFTLGLTDLSVRLRRRSLVVVLTDFVDTITAELMIENLERLARRHVVVFVTMRDPELDEQAGGLPFSATELHRVAVANDLVREREVVIRRLQRLGVMCIDAAPGEISTQLINRYLDIKRRELV